MYTFEVRIGKDESVAALKEYNWPNFREVDAKSLVIWNASAPFDKNPKDHIKALGLVVGDSLQPPDILSLHVFQFGLEKRTVHIVVDRLPSGPGEL
jgi:Crinkler effector protein N-terminal domain